LTHEEVTTLLNVAPFERAMLYEVALSTGLRAKELRSLTLEHLDVERSGLRLDAAWTKNRKPGFQPIPSDLVQRLLDFVHDGIVDEKYKRFYSRDDCKPPPKNRLFYILSNPTKAFDEDIEAAGIPKKTKEGKVDFHALRVTYATLVVESGATVKEAQELLRHASPEMTMNVYAKVRPGRLRGVVEDVSRAVNCLSISPLNGHSKPSSGHQDTPKERSNRNRSKRATSVTDEDSEGCNDILIVEAVGIEAESVLGVYIAQTDTQCLMVDNRVATPDKQ